MRIPRLCYLPISLLPPSVLIQFSIGHLYFYLQNIFVQCHAFIKYIGCNTHCTYKFRVRSDQDIKGSCITKIKFTQFVSSQTNNDF